MWSWRNFFIHFYFHQSFFFVAWRLWFYLKKVVKRLHQRTKLLWGGTKKKKKRWESFYKKDDSFVFLAKKKKKLPGASFLFKRLLSCFSNKKKLKSLMFFEFSLLHEEWIFEPKTRKNFSWFCNDVEILLRGLKPKLLTSTFSHFRKCRKQKKKLCRQLMKIDCLSWNTKSLLKENCQNSAEATKFVSATSVNQNSLKTKKKRLKKIIMIFCPKFSLFFLTKKNHFTRFRKKKTFFSQKFPFWEISAKKVFLSLDFV